MRLRGCGSLFVIINDIRTFRGNMLDNTVVNARLIGEYAVTPLVFNDREGAEDLSDMFSNTWLRINDLDPNNPFKTTHKTPEPI